MCKKRPIAFALALLLLSISAGTASAYPDAEIDWAFGGGPPFDFGITGTPSGFDIISDTEVSASYGKVLKLIDTGSYSLEAEQPFDISSDTDTDSVIAAVNYVSSSSEIPASLESGTLLVFPLANVASKPKFVQITEGNDLGPIAVDSARGVLYVSDNTSRLIHVVDPLSMTVKSSITLTIQGNTSFKVTGAHFVVETDESYFTTDGGGVFYLPVDATAATLIDVDVLNKAELVALDQVPNGTTLYVVNASDTEVVKISTSSHAVTGSAIDLSPNADLTDIAITRVTNPTGTYAYVAGTNGLSVINTGTDQVLDFGSDAGVDGEPMPTSAEPLLVEVSSLDDGFVYVLFSTGKFGVISENPFVAISSITYSNGGSSMGQGDSFTITFASDVDGTYEIRAGGNNLASGSLLVDSSGATSGPIVADTDTDVTINYDDNSTLFSEGTNTIWVFVTEGALRGRRSTEVSVDTPPPDVVISSTGFGNQRVYVNFERIDVEDMSSYSVYADTDPAQVLTKSDASATVSQPSSGGTLTAEVTGLTNGTLYYFAMEAVDAAGNISPNRTNLLPDGSAVTGTPQAVEGPAGASGETGCALGGSPSSAGRCVLMALMAPLLAVALRFGRRARRAAVMVLVAVLLLMPQAASAQTGQTVEEADIPTGYELLHIKPPSWTIELKTGFWMPTSKALDPFFSNCCNMWTRFQAGHLWLEKYGVEFGFGFLYSSGKAVGSQSGQQSQESYSFLLIPLEVSGVWRADYWPNFRYIIPYLKGGIDSVIFREKAGGTTTKGLKWGMHFAGGLQLNIGMIGDARRSLAEISIKDFFMTLEGEYKYINNFGGKGLDLSGPIFSIGFLFYF